MRTGIYVRVYNEKNIIEWMDYHYKCGFDFILFYDDHSEPSVKSIIEDYGKFDKSKYLVLERLYPKMKSNKAGEVGNCPKIFINTFLPHIRKHMDYVLYIDIDEYLYLNTYKNIKELIKDYGNFDQLFINWNFFKKFMLTNKNSNSLINSFMYSKEYIEGTGKSLCKVSSIYTSNNPHFFKLNSEDCLTIDINKNLIHKGEFNKIYYKDCVKKNYENNKLNLINNGIYIAHYYTQDLKTYFERKYLRFYNNKPTDIKIINFFINNYNNIEKKEKYLKNKNDDILKIFLRYIGNTIRTKTIRNNDIYNFYYDINTTTNNKNKIEN